MLSVKSIENASRKAWLAGLGSIVLSKEFAANKIDQAYTETTQLVTNLMSVGEKLEKSNENRFPDVDQRILQIREKLGLDSHQPNQLQELEARVAHLADVVNKLVEAKSAEALRATQVKKPRATSAKSAANTADAEVKAALKAKAAPKVAEKKAPAATKKATTRRRAPAKKAAASTVKTTD